MTFKKETFCALSEIFPTIKQKVTLSVNGKWAGPHWEFW